jgi:hypothetical protein
MKEMTRRPVEAITPLEVEAGSGSLQLNLLWTLVLRREETDHCVFLRLNVIAIVLGKETTNCAKALDRSRGDHRSARKEIQRFGAV